MKEKGQITFGFGVLWASITTTLSIAGVYFTNQAAIADKVNIAKTEIYTDIGANQKTEADNRAADLQRIATLEEAIKTLKDNSTETRNDVKALLQFVGVRK